MKPLILSALSLALVCPPAEPGPDLLHWTDCPQGLSYSNAADPMGAHFQLSPVAGPSGGTCSLEVVTGSIFVPAGDTAGGVAFPTPGEAAGETYTLAFDFQSVSGDDDWFFSNENGAGDINGLGFSVPFAGDRCWHHYEYTAPVGPVGPKGVLYIYQGRTHKNPAPTFEEMRVDNMTLRVARGSPQGSR